MDFAKWYIKCFSIFLPLFFTFFGYFSPIYIYKNVHSNICIVYTQEFHKLNNCGFLMRTKKIRYFLILMLKGGGEQILIPPSLLFSSPPGKNDGAFFPFSGLSVDSRKCQAACQYWFSIEEGSCPASSKVNLVPQCTSFDVI